MADYSLVPVEHQPDFENVALVPVDHDPFSADGVTQQARSPQAHAQQAQTQPAQSQQAQTKQPAMGASRSSAPIPGVATTDSTGSALTAGASDFFRSIPRGVVSGFNSAASALGRATQAEMGQDVDAPTQQQGMQILEKEVTGPMYRPESRAGQFGASVGEFLGNPASYLAPGSLPFKVGTAVLGGLGSEVGGQLGEGTPWEGPLRFAGGALGVLGPARLGAGVRAAPAVTDGVGAVRTLAGGSMRAAASPVEESAASVADKLERYLLDPEHVSGGPKAKWFEQALGFTRENAQDLAKQLVFDKSQAAQRAVTQHGTHFNQTIHVTGANGRTTPVITGWTVGPDGVPRLSTVLPRSK